MASPSSARRSSLHLPHQRRLSRPSRSLCPRTNSEVRTNLPYNCKDSVPLPEAEGQRRKRQKEGTKEDR
ncbi:hypothetical protein B296_00015879 [Ensete ventricosum]|uniref:Uncharacterized protein n=1 Tax=Ensete ventricosum TaxID=4639 RepID=A0A426YKY7_ENSVE|nr:hypothetical protein B296_00015879 [Ensete ventricosum]